MKFHTLSKIDRLRLVLLVVVSAAFASSALADSPIYDNPPINYSASTPHDPAIQIKHDIESGNLKLTKTGQHGYLDDLLKALHISPASQALVFSQTSFQQQLISPTNPRALYFNDEIYVGYVPGGDVIEIASTDPKLGTVFYTVQQPKPDTAGPPKMLRQTDSCLQCHGQSMTRDIPGLLIRSVYPNADGQPIFSAGTFITTQESPFAERWGGWYITGHVGGIQHMGNAMFTQEENKDPKPTAPPLHDLKDLSAQINTASYPNAESDIVPLLVLEHQTQAHNLITRCSYETQLALRDEKILADALNEKLQPNVHSDSTQSRIRGACEPLIEYLLFSNEPQLPKPIVSTSNFAKEFPNQGPRDAKNRSPRDFDLQTRLFRYPCSYLIYSPSFDGLPDAAKYQIYMRLVAILSGEDTSKPFAHLTQNDRTAILEILRETKPALREFCDKASY